MSNPLVEVLINEVQVHKSACKCDPCLACDLMEKLATALHEQDARIGELAAHLDQQETYRERLEDCCFELTEKLVDHPNGRNGEPFDGPCLCGECRAAAGGDILAEVP